MRQLKFLSNNFLFDSNPYRINYQIPRAMIAFAQLITLMFTKYEYLFYNMEGKHNYLFSNEFGYFSSFLILVWVISGILPQLSSLLHFYLSYSFTMTSEIMEGGDQVAQILTLLLIPICLFDKRLNLWGSVKRFNYKTPTFIKLFTKSCLKVMHIQMALIYLFAGAVKINVPEWADGSAMYYWFNHTMGAANSDAVKLIFDSLFDSHFLSPLLTWSVLMLEFILFGALFLDKRSKMTLFFPAIMFHLGIGIVFGLWGFSLTMAAGLMLYLGPKFLSKKSKKPNKRPICEVVKQAA